MEETKYPDITIVKAKCIPLDLDTMEADTESECYITTYEINDEILN